MKISERKTLTIDLTDMPKGKRYEDEYGEYIKIFERIAHTDPEIEITVRYAPLSWLPLLRYLNCNCVKYQIYFRHDDSLRNFGKFGDYNYVLDRTTLEVLCGFRPETADCLWKVDCQWKSERVIKFEDEENFIVTNNGSYSRKEIRDYLETLHTYIPKKKKVVLVPCAADKPYPSPLHEKVKSLIPDDCYLMILTGVLGLIPEDLWDVAPTYDCGIANRWRIVEEVTRYFSRYGHEWVVCHIDFYSQAVDVSFKSIQYTKAFFTCPVQFYADYTDLLSDSSLQSLLSSMQRAESSISQPPG